MEHKEYREHSMFDKNNLLRWIFPKGYYLHFYKSFDMTYHSHKRLELMYVVMGEMHFLYKTDADGENKAVDLTIHPNEYVFIDAEVPHKIYVDDTDTQIYNIEFSLGPCADSDFTLYNLQAKDAPIKAFLSSDERIFRLRDNGALLQNLILIQNYIGNGINTDGDKCLNFMLSSFLLLIARDFEESNKRVSGIGYLNCAVNYIYDNFNQNVTLTQLASYCGISENYLNRLFKTHFSTTAMNFLNRYRIERAASLLSGTELPINEVCAQSGFKNNMNFSQNFKKFMGTTPGKFRSESHTANRVKSHELDKQNFYAY